MVDADDDSEYGFFRRLLREGGCDVEIGAPGGGVEALKKAPSFTNANACTTSMRQVAASRVSGLLAASCLSRSP
jgi:hypothetical protein